MGLRSPAGVITTSRQSVVASFSLANPRRVLRTVSAVWEGLCNVSRFIVIGSQLRGLSSQWEQVLQAAEEDRQLRDSGLAAGRK